MYNVYYGHDKGECTIECLNIDKNYTPYKSIQDFFLMIQMEMVFF